MEGKDMENSNNTFLAAKAAIAAVCGAFTAAFGWLGWLVVAAVQRRQAAASGRVP